MDSFWIGVVAVVDSEWFGIEVVVPGAFAADPANTVVVFKEMTLIWWQQLAASPAIATFPTKLGLSAEQLLPGRFLTGASVGFPNLGQVGA